MKEKLLSFLLFFLAAGYMPAWAEDSKSDSVEVTLNVDAPDHVEASLHGDSVLALQAGANTFKVALWTNITFTAKKGFILSKVTDMDGNEQSITDYQSTCIVMVADSPLKYSFSVTTSAVTDIHFTLSVDHAAKIKVNMADYSSLNVVDGENALTIPSNKLPISISAAKWGDSFYEVLLDGQNIAYKYGYAVTPHEGSVVKVTTDFPDKDCKLTLVLPDGIKKFFTAVVVDDNLITDFSKDIVLKAGTKAKLYYNPSFWSSDPEQAVSVTVNGEKTSWFGPGYSIVMRDNTIVKVVQAIAVPTIHVKVKINKDNAATIYRSSETYYDTVTLKANDEQEVELPDDDGNKIVVKTVSDEETIKGINLNDEPVSLDGNNYAEIGDLVNGDHISIFMKNSTTGIDAVKATTAKKEVYNLLGQKVGNCRHAKGIFIMNGKKVVLK